MPYTNGYVKLHRKVLDNAWLQNGDLWRFWCWCLLKASYKPHVATVGFQRVPLLPGQFIFGRKVASSELVMSEQTVRTCLQALLKRENLTIKTTNKFSVLTVVNWELYQSSPDEPTSNSTSHQPTTNQELTTNKEVVEIEAGEEKNIYRSIFDRWNSKGMVQHRVLSDKIKRKVNGLLGDGLTEEEINFAIDNYAVVLKGPEYYWSHKWNLEDFLSRGAKKFVPVMEPLQNFRKKDQVDKRTQELDTLLDNLH